MITDTDIIDTAADWTPEGGADDDAAACPVCGNALEIDADGWYICDHCEMAWQDAPAATEA